jgi:hypothetical protein
MVVSMVIVLTCNTVEHIHRHFTVFGRLAHTPEVVANGRSRLHIPLKLDFYSRNKCFWPGINWPEK